MMGVLMALGWLLLTLLKIAGVLLLILLVLLALVLLCPLCADVCWEGGVLTVRAGALGPDRFLHPQLCGQHPRQHGPVREAGPR